MKSKQHFSLSIGSFGGNNIEVYGDGLTITYEEFYFLKGENKIKSIEPTPEQWSLFWDAIHSICSKWKKEYFNHEILDGTQWEVKIFKSGFKLKAFGSNEYPPNWSLFTSELKKMLNIKID